MLFVLPVAFSFAQSQLPTSVQYTIKNPLASDDVNSLLNNIMKIVMQVGGVVVVLFIIYSGYKFVTAGDSDSDRKNARQIFYATVIGGLILLGADIIASIIINTINVTVGKK